MVNRQKEIRLSRTKLGRWVRKILREIGLKRVHLSLVLVNDSEIRRFHERFLGQDCSTDVLAFEPPKRFVPRPDPSFLGDVIVSIEAAKKAGPRFGNRWDEELLLYICHGVLHLRGYRDSTRREKARMERKQEAILQKTLGKQWRSKERKRLF